ncbi:hypothetical protein OFAG_02232 [Oxalobacter formigenes HOxBLS]|uniref:Uncharacterized protein n=1 Tax=Oxalobacter paraformigenes TaxID=556268 RepID=T5LPQ8_9BURK|nr:hypothetical protein OFAG_02232 [Oxalobacter paraformigenes]
MKYHPVAISNVTDIDYFTVAFSQDFPLHREKTENLYKLTKSGCPFLFSSQTGIFQNMHSAFSEKPVLFSKENVS